MRRVYLVLAIAGAIVPYVFFVDFFRGHGIDLVAFLRGTFANGAAGGAMMDLVMSSGVFWIYMFTRQDGPRPWLFIALNLGIGLSCALPAYLYAASARRGSARAPARPPGTAAGTPTTPG